MFLCVSVLQEGPGRLLHRLFVPDGDQHALRLPRQDSHSGLTFDLCSYVSALGVEVTQQEVAQGRGRG